MKPNIEILSPAGSYESLKAAITAGADAVYVGGTRFGARAYANNLQEAEMLEAIDYVHLHGRKIYMTVNTLLKETELENELYEYLLPYYKHGLDAVIVQDIGVLQFIKKQFPDLPIHASTQMTLTNLLGVQFLEKLGVERIVTSRELNLDEIKEISRNSKMEIESFVHGALCYCYSGQCLYSSMLGGRSGNRGQCAQPCRLPYQVNGDKKSKYVLSLKDICTLDSIPDLIEAGIYSFKIEGRMKKPEYVGLVTAMYRKYVDLYLKNGKKGFKVDPKDREKLMDLYNRGGFHGGYYHEKNGPKMVSIDRPNHAGVPALKLLKQSGRSLVLKAIVDLSKGDVIEIAEDENYTLSNGVPTGQNLTINTHQRINFEKDKIFNRTRNERLITEIKQTIIEKKVVEKIDGVLSLEVGKPATFYVSCNGVSVSAKGNVVQEAINQPMDVSRIEKQLRKTGNTEFEFENLSIELIGNIFVPMQELNEIRRGALQMLNDEIVAQYRRNHVDRVEKELNDSNTSCDTMVSVSVETLEQLQVVLDYDFVKRVYLDCNAIDKIWANTKIQEITKSVHDKGKEIFLGMPHVFRKENIVKYQANYVQLFQAEWDGILVRNYESMEFLKKNNYAKAIVTDFNLYQFNQRAQQFWKQENVETTTAPLELNVKELTQLGLQDSELIVYGYYPMMISAQCVHKTTRGCDCEKGKLVLKDRYKKTFLVKNNCDYCYNIIYNTLPVYLMDQKEELYNLNPKSYRIHFTLEDKATTKEVLELFNNAAEPKFEFTRGHFKRGIK